MAAYDSDILDELREVRLNAPPFPTEVQCATIEAYARIRAAQIIAESNERVAKLRATNSEA